MVKLAKYLKPYTVIIMTAIILLFVQAISDLSLPDYMSNIVNKGIQQGGIENAVPVAVRHSTMEKLMPFIDKEYRDMVNDSYILVDKTSPDYEMFLDKYPRLEEEPVYVLKNIDSSELDRLNPVMGKAFLSVSSIEKMEDIMKSGAVPFNGIKMPFAAMDDKMIIQSAVPAVKVEYIALGMDTGKIQNSYITRTGIVMLLISLLGGISSVLVGLLAAKAAAGLSRDLRRDVFTKVENFSNTEFDKFSTASLITRTTNDITQIQMLIIIMIRMVISAPIMGVGGVFKAIGKSTSMSWIIALAVLVLLGLILTVFSIAMPKFKLIQKLVDRLNLVTRENLSGMMVIRAFNTQDFEKERFDRANRELTDTNLFVNRVMVFMMPAMMFIMNGISLLIIWVGAHQIENSGMQVGDMMAFMQYGMQILFSFLMMSMMFIMIPRASVSAQRIAEVLETELVILDPEEPGHFGKDTKGLVEFRNVSFRYPGAEEDVLKDISFKAYPGQTTAVIGSTGSGKTTLINLIPRFYDVTGGAVLIDDMDVRSVEQKELREKIGYVPQKASLFSGTIESNLKYADENATEEDLKKAAEIAQAMEFINEKQEGMGREISQGGTNVSGGQKQRLSIARALVKKPRIYIFDDSFSALDFRTDAALRRELKAQTGGSTMLIVAQRISTIINAEQIIVLDEGRIAGIGTHKELMKNCSTYKEIALSQLSKEELA
ncbi:MAG TPA: ABC transporter ATP-binding protein [Clostridia bacterium]|nr:ABC transporter ATP-binding protein [Clostridia bacterium]